MTAHSFEHLPLRPDLPLVFMAIPYVAQGFINDKKDQ